jgi:hypothetical protein
MAKLLCSSEYANELELPLWSELTEIGDVTGNPTVIVFDTSYAHYVDGGKAIIWSDEHTYEIVNIATVAGGQLNLESNVIGDYTSAVVMPVKDVTFLQAPEFSRNKSNRIWATVVFLTTDATDISDVGSYSTYRSHLIMDDRPILSANLSESIYSEIESVDNDSGVISKRNSVLYSMFTSSVGWAPNTKASVWALRQWLYTLRGMWKGFWVPTWVRDIEILSNLTTAGNSISIQTIGFTDLGSTRDILIRELNGTDHYLRVLGATAGSPGEEDLTTSGTIGFNLDAVDIDFACFMNFMRLNSDRVEIIHRVAGGANVVIPTMVVPEP